MVAIIVGKFSWRHIVIPTTPEVHQIWSEHMLQLLYITFGLAVCLWAKCRAKVLIPTLALCTFYQNKDTNRESRSNMIPKDTPCNRMISLMYNWANLSKESMAIIGKQ